MDGLAVGASVKVGGRLGTGVDVGLSVGAVVRVGVGRTVAPAPSRESVGWWLLAGSVRATDKGRPAAQLLRSHQVTTNTKPTMATIARMPSASRAQSGRKDSPQMRHSAVP